jgi:hypothetical protein
MYSIVDRIIASLQKNAIPIFEFVGNTGQIVIGVEFKGV